MADGFLGRWSRRKAGMETKEEASLEKKGEALKEMPPTPAVEKAAEEVPPPATLEDVAKIDRFDPDFSAFMRPDVDPAVQQAALKKMFTDPHFNIMDGLDIYIDDYSKPDPLSPGMLERMVQGDMLNLFRKKGEELVQEGRQNVDQVPISKAEGETLSVEQQSDLTSKHIEAASTTDPLDEASNKVTNVIPVQQEPKKT